MMRMMTMMMTGVSRVVFGLFVFGLGVLVAFHCSVVGYFCSCFFFRGGHPLTPRRGGEGPFSSL